MKRSSVGHFNCSIARALDVVGEWWTLARPARRVARRAPLRGHPGRPRRRPQRPLRPAHDAGRPRRPRPNGGTRSIPSATSTSSPTWGATWSRCCSPSCAGATVGSARRSADAARAPRMWPAGGAGTSTATTAAGGWNPAACASCMGPAGASRWSRRRPASRSGAVTYRHRCVTKRCGVTVRTGAGADLGTGATAVTGTQPIDEQAVAAPTGVHPLRVQLRHRGPARRRRRPPLRAHPRRQGPPGLAGLHLREGAAPRPLPERPRPADHAAAAPRRRHVRGDRLGHRDPRGGRAARRGARHPRRRVDLLLRRRRARGTTSAAPTAARRCGRSARAYRSNALAQEKTGEFWVNGRMLGATVRGDFEHCEVALFVGKNPWQSHGIPRARTTLKEIAHDPDRTLIVIDPRRTETAELADIHLAGAPRHRRLAARRAGRRPRAGGPASTGPGWPSTRPGSTTSRPRSARSPVGRLRRDRGRRRGAASARPPGASPRASSVAVFEDLGVQMNRHSTLVQLPREAGVGADRQLRQAGRAVRADRAGGARRDGDDRSDGGGSERSARSPAPGSSAGWCRAT